MYIVYPTGKKNPVMVENDDELYFFFERSTYHRDLALDLYVGVMITFVVLTLLIRFV